MMTEVRTRRGQPGKGTGLGRSPTFAIAAGKFDWAQPSNKAFQRGQARLKSRRSDAIFSASPWVMAALLITVPTSAYAQTADAQAAPTQVAQSSSQTSLEDIIVTARKRSENLQVVPIAVTAFTNAELATKQIVSVTDLQSHTPGLAVMQSVYSNLGAYVGIRGLLTGDAQLVLSPTIGLYVDDVYQPALTGLFAPDLEDTAQIEVLKGPQGTLYGRNTIGGAIKITHILPDYSGLSGTYKAGLGNFGRRNLSAAVNVPLVGEKAALRISAQYLKTTGYGSDRVTGARLADINAKSIRGILRLDPTEQMSIVFNANYAHAKTGGLIADIASVNPGFSAAALQAGLETAFANPAQYGSELAALRAGNVLPVAALGNAELNRYLELTRQDPYNPHLRNPQSGDFKRKEGSAVIKLDITDNVLLKSVTAYNEQRSFNTQQTSASPFNIVYGQGQGQVARQFTQELQLSGDFFDQRFNWTAGYFYFHLSGYDSSDPFFNLPLVITTSNPQRRRVNVRDISNAVYAQGSFAVTDAINLTGGIRYTSETQRVITLSVGSLPNGGTFCLNNNIPVTPTTPCRNQYSNQFRNVSYLGGIDWKVSDDAFLYASTSRGFKAGGQNAFGFAATATSPAVGLGGFEPELATNYEVGAKTDWFDRRLRINGALFRINYNDLQQTVLTAGAFGTVIEIVNAASARITGAEIDITARPVRSLTVQASGNYLKTRYIDYVINGVDLSNRPLKGIPKFQSSVSVTYDTPTPLGEFAIGGTWFYKSTVNYSPDSRTVFSGDTQIQRAYSLFDATASLTVTEGLKISAFVKNIFDRFYAVGSVDLSAVGYTLRYPSPPRTFGVELSGRF